MKTLVSLTAALVLAAPGAAQLLTTIGGTNSNPSGGNRGKANGISIKSSVLLLDFDMWLNVPGKDTLTFFIYHRNSPKGTFNLMKSWKVNVDGTNAGAKWYSSGRANPTPLLCGNSYILGCAWTSTVTYAYNRSSCGRSFALGNWLFARTTSNPIPATLGSGCDIAEYHQRFRTIPFVNVGCVGTGCGSTSTGAPRLLASTPPQLGKTLTIELVNGVASVPAMYLFAPGATLTTPVNIAGCSIWLDLRLPVLTLAASLSAAGEGVLKIPIPSSTAFRGVKVSTQAGVLGKTLDITNAVNLTSY